jgi:hypothetical protein
MSRPPEVCGAAEGRRPQGSGTGLSGGFRDSLPESAAVENVIPSLRRPYSFATAFASRFACFVEAARRSPTRLDTSKLVPI